jgi:hypothetical protein
MGKNVSFHGGQQFVRRVWNLPQHRLTANDDEFCCARNRSRRPDDMFKLGSFHGFSARKL